MYTKLRALKILTLSFWCSSPCTHSWGTLWPVPKGRWPGGTCWTSSTWWRSLYTGHQPAKYWRSIWPSHLHWTGTKHTQRPIKMTTFSQWYMYKWCKYKQCIRNAKDYFNTIFRVHTSTLARSLLNCKLAVCRCDVQVVNRFLLICWSKYPTKYNTKH